MLALTVLQTKRFLFSFDLHFDDCVIVCESNCCVRYTGEAVPMKVHAFVIRVAVKKRQWRCTERCASRRQWAPSWRALQQPTGRVPCLSLCSPPNEVRIPEIRLWIWIPKKLKGSVCSFTDHKISNVFDCSVTTIFIPVSWGTSSMINKEMFYPPRDLSFAAVLDSCFLFFNLQRKWTRRGVRLCWRPRYGAGEKASSASWDTATCWTGSQNVTGKDMNEEFYLIKMYIVSFEDPSWISQFKTGFQDKIWFPCRPSPCIVRSLTDRRVVKIVCGSFHTMVLTANSQVRNRCCCVAAIFGSEQSGNCSLDE